MHAASAVTHGARKFSWQQVRGSLSLSGSVSASVAACVSLTLTLSLCLSLSVGADVNAEDGHGVRPLHLAAMQGDRELTAALLAAKGGQGAAPADGPAIDVNAADRQGRTALLCATMEGHTEVVKLLVEEGEADLSVKDLNGADALEWAVDLEHFEIVQLLQAGQSGTVAAAEGP